MIKTKKFYIDSLCQRGKTKILFTLLVSLVLAGLFSAYIRLSRKPDIEIKLERRFEIKADLATLLKQFNQTSLWPKWYFHLKKVLPKNQNSQIQSKGDFAIHSGDHFIFKMEPPTRQWTRFDLELEVLSFTPNKEISFKLISDSSQKITTLFETLQWKVTIENNQLVGSISGKTKVRRARFYARFTPEILLNQVFYPDLKVIAGHSNPDMEEPKSPFK